MEAGQQSSSQQWKPSTNIIFNSLEKALYLWDAFKLYASRGWGVVSNSQAVRGLRNLLGRLESYQRGVNWNIPFKCRRLKPWVDFFQRILEKWKSRAQKPADSYFWGGGCSGNSRGKTWGLISLAIRALAAWPCHGWNSSRWLLAAVDLSFVFIINRNS